MKQIAIGNLTNYTGSRQYFDVLPKFREMAETVYSMSTSVQEVERILIRQYIMAVNLRNWHKKV